MKTNKTIIFNIVLIVAIIVLLIILLVEVNKLSNQINIIKQRIAPLKVCENSTRAFPNVLCSNQSIWDNRGDYPFDCTLSNGIRKCVAIIDNKPTNIVCWEEYEIIEQCKWV